MNGPLPVEGQKVEVKLVEGDWQEAVYRDANFVDLYGLPLEVEKISEWRAVAVTPAVKPALNGASRIQRSTLAKAPAPTN